LHCVPQADAWGYTLMPTSRLQRKPVRGVRDKASSPSREDGELELPRADSILGNNYLDSTNGQEQNGGVR
jgi:hypothetical protein